MFLKFFRIRLPVAGLVIIGATCSSCGKDEDAEKGSAFGLKPLRPPFEKTSAFDGTSLLLQNAKGLALVKERLFSGGPTDIKERLKAVDDTTARIESELQGSSPKQCVREEAVEIKSPTLPSGGTFSMWLQCRNEPLADGSVTAFGKKDERFYLYDVMYPNGSSSPFITMASSNLEGTEVEFWTVTSTKDSKSVPYATRDEYNYTHGAAAESTGISEYTTGGLFSGLAVNCRLRMRMNKSHVYVDGTLAAFDYPAGEDCANGTGKEPVTKTCATGKLEDVDVANCSSLTSFALPALTYALGEAAGGYSQAVKFEKIDISTIMSVSAGVSDKEL
jgi:hypothetical protein